MSDGQRGWPAAPERGRGGGLSWPAPVQPMKPPRVIPPWAWWVGGVAAVILVAGAVWGGVKLWGVFQASGKEQITELHRLMVAQDAGAIFAASDAAYQRDVGREQSDEIFQVVREHMGDPLSYSVQNVNMTSNAQYGTIENLVLATQFTKGEATETLRYHKVNGVWRMLAYRCNSDLLKGVHLKAKKKTEDEDGQ